MADRRWMQRLRTPVNADQYAKTLVASGALATGDNKQEEGRIRSTLTRAAQSQVWAYRHQIGELGHAIQFYENCFSRIRLTLAVEEDDGSRSPVFDEDGKELVSGAKDALQALRELRSPIGGTTQIMRAIGGCLGAVGECHVVGVDNAAMSGGKAFEAYSPSEFFLPATATYTASTDTKELDYHHVKVPGQPPAIVNGKDAMVIRIWQPDTEYSLLPWAPALGMLDIFDELVLLTREVAGAVRSRLALAGILLIADDVDFPDREDAEPGSDELDPFTAQLIKVASTAIKDKSSAAGVVPLVVRVPRNQMTGSVAGSFELIEFARKWDDSASAKRDECVTRFAQGIDLPVETVRGHMQTTFANAAQISADLYRSYIEPKVVIAADALTTGYLRVVLGGQSPFVIDHDPTDLVVHPDQIGDWERGFDRFAVSFASYRNKLGASEEDAPDEDELVLRLLLEIAKHARPMPGESVTTAAPTPAELGGEIGPAGTSGEPGDTEVDQGIQAAIEVEVRRVMHRVGARLRSKLSNNPGLKSSLATVKDQHVAATLGPATVASLMSETELLGREFDILAGYVEEQFGKVIAERVYRDGTAAAKRRLFEPAGV